MKRLLTSIWLLGLVITIPVVFSLPELFSKYRLSLVLQETAAHPVNYRIFFKDLDGNGTKEKIYAFPNSVGQLAFQYFGNNGSMINQINFTRKFLPNMSYLFFWDCDKNGKSEVYGFTMNQDSLFLNWAVLAHPYSNNSESLFITRVGASDNGKVNFSVNRFACTDLDGDNNNEILFSIVSGYSKFPRMIVIYHPDTGELLKSKDDGLNPYYMGYFDLNRDGKSEILAGSGAGYNLTDSTGNVVTDIRPYLQAYDINLKVYFPPVPFSAGINNHIQFFFNDVRRKEIAVFQFNRSLATEKMVGIYKVDFTGNLKDSVFFPEFGKRFAFQVFQIEGEYWMYTGDKMVLIDKNLKVLDVKEIDVSNFMYRNQMIVKGLPEFATTDLLMKKACIYTDNFDFKVELSYVNETIRNIIMDTNMGPDCFMVQTNANEYTYRFQKNWLYYLKFPIYVFIYLLSVVFVWLIQRIREKQLTERYELQTQLHDLEIKYLRMQMDPHFMFNAFTTMALLLKNGKQEDALGAFMKFTHMVRSNFDFSDRLTRPLTEELQIIGYYLEINKLRFKEKLYFEVVVTEEVPKNALIPKMMLQIHVENALKHGISKLDKMGIIRIKVRLDGDLICFSIEDNGIGRQKAAALNRPSTKQGIKMLQALYDRLNQQNKSKISQFYTDLTDEQGNPAGTQVDIRVPLNLKETPGV